MTALDDLDINDLNDLVNTKIRKKSTQLVSRVKNQIRQGDILRAEVQGTRLYSVEILATEAGVEAICTCPYDWGGYCKHIGAVLLKWIISSHSFPVEQLAPHTSDGVIEIIPVEILETYVPDELPSWLALPYKERSKQNDEVLREWLREYKVQELRQIAGKQGWSIKGTRKDDIIDQLIELLVQPREFLKSLTLMGEEHLQVYQALGALYPGIAYDLSYLEALVNQWGKLTKYKNITTYIDHICELGLAVPASRHYGYFNRIAFIPATIWRVLPPLLADHVPEAELPEHTESEVRFGSPKSFLQRFHQALLLLDQSHPPLRPPAPRPRLEKYHEILREWDYLPQEIDEAYRNNKLKDHNSKLELTIPPPKSPFTDETIQALMPIVGSQVEVDFFYYLMRTIGLLQPGSPATVWKEVKEQFFKRTEAEQWAILLNGYFEMFWWNEVWMVMAERPDLKLKRANLTSYQLAKLEDFYGILAVFRTQIIHLLAFLPDDKWVSVSEITDLLHLLMNRFDSQCWSQARYPGDRRPAWFVTENGRFLDTAANREDWEKTHGEFIRQVIQGPLHWLGAADITLEHGRLVAFRLHGIHQLYLDQVESIPLAGLPKEDNNEKVPSTTADEPVKVSGLNIVVDPTAVSAQTHNYFDTIARLGSVDPKRFVYQVDASAVHQSFERGQTLEQLVEGWQTSLEIPIPETVLNQLKSWWEAYGRVRLYENVTVIEFSDQYALAEMKAITSLKKHLVAEISPNLVVIPEHVVDTLVMELEKAGYTPKQTDNDN